MKKNIIALHNGGPLLPCTPLCNSEINVSQFFKNDCSLIDFE